MLLESNLLGVEHSKSYRPRLRFIRPETSRAEMRRQFIRLTSLWTILGTVGRTLHSGHRAYSDNNFFQGLLRRFDSVLDCELEKSPHLPGACEYAASQQFAQLRPNLL